MVNEQKQKSLEKYHTIVLATLTYLEQRLGQSIIYDDINPITEYYQEQKLQTEKNFKQRKLDRLQQRFTSLTKTLKNAVDLNFSNYIKEKTGYDVDIFEDLKKRIDVIFTQNKILNRQNLDDVSIALDLYQKSSNKENYTERLNILLARYIEAQSISKTNSRVISKVIKKIDNETEEVTITETTGTKLKHFDENIEISPDGKRKVRTTQWADKYNSGTYVSVDFPSANGPVYGTTGIQPIVKAWWKDNSTIIIETGEDLPAYTQYKKVSSFEDVITIEYILH